MLLFQRLAIFLKFKNDSYAIQLNTDTCAVKCFLKILLNINENNGDRIPLSNHAL